jgi:hypothetical protein
MGHGADPSRSSNNRRSGSDNDSGNSRSEMNTSQTPNDSPDGESGDGGDGGNRLNPSRTPSNLPNGENGYGEDGGDGPGPSGTRERCAQTVCHQTSFTLQITPRSDSERFLRIGTCLKAGDNH